MNDDHNIEAIEAKIKEDFDDLYERIKLLISRQGDNASRYTSTYTYITYLMSSPGIAK